LGSSLPGYWFAVSFPGKALLDSVLHLPARVLPPVVVGYLLLVVDGAARFYWRMVI
jgi:ABC-type molybdate transport system permease subunit